MRGGATEQGAREDEQSRGAAAMDAHGPSFLNQRVARKKLGERASEQESESESD